MPSAAMPHCATSSGSTSSRAASGSPSAACSLSRSPSMTATATSSPTRLRSSPKPAPRSSTGSTRGKYHLVGGALLDRYVDIFDVALRLGNGQSILPPPGQVQFYRLAGQLLPLFHFRAPRNASRKIRHICGIAAKRLFDHNPLAPPY